MWTCKPSVQIICVKSSIPINRSKEMPGPGVLEVLPYGEILDLISEVPSRDSLRFSDAMSFHLAEVSFKQWHRV